MKKEIYYRFNPDLSFVTNDYPGNKLINGVFQNDEFRYHPSWVKMLKWGLSRNPQNKDKKSDNFKLNIQYNSRFIRQDEDIIVWLGHSAFFIRIDGVQILIDPCLLSLPFHKRQIGLPCRISDFRDIDYILLSHGHRDHCDLPSLKKIYKNNPEVEILTALDISKILKPLAGIKIQEAGWYQQYRTDKVDITFLPALHWNRRYLHDMDRSLWGSFFIRANNTTLYFAGDTGYGKHFKEIRQVMGKPDICFMPIGAYKPDYIMKGAHVNPVEAIKAFHDLDASFFIPMHYGTYDLSDEPLGEPIQKVRKAFSSKRMRGELTDLAVGEVFPILKKQANFFRSN